MANPRNYVKDADDTLTSVNASDYETGKGANARLRKINLNVDLATQAELNDAFNLLSNAIAGATGDLTAYYTKSEADAISTALSTAVKATDDAISAQLSTFALSTTVADAYKVTVEKDATATEGYAATYTVKQGGTAVDVKINIPKDFLVKSAELCTVTVADQPYDGAQVGDKYIDFVVNTEDQSETAKHVYLPVNDLVDVYTGGSTTFADVNVDNNRVITVNVSADTISAAAVAAVVGTSEDASSANTIYGAKKYAEEKAAAVAVSAEGDTGDGALVTADDANNMITVGSTQKLKDAVTAAESALQTISKGTDGTYVTTTVGTKTNNDQTVTVELTFGELSAGTTGVAKAEEVKAYVDTAISGVDGKFVKGLNSQTTAYVDITGDTSLTGNKIVTVNASEKVTGAVDKVELCASIWDTVTNKADLTALEAEATTRENANKFLSGKIDALSSSLNAAEGDDYISAYVDGNTVKVEALCATVWNEVSAKIDTSKVVAAANKLSVLTLSALEDYQDIDMIISEVEKIKGALINFTTALEA